ncbi:MAG: hypothetical protein R3C14_17585 [Caldilineaceae bacterium]
MMNSNICCCSSLRVIPTFIPLITTVRRGVQRWAQALLRGGDGRNVVSLPDPLV